MQSKIRLQNVFVLPVNAREVDVNMLIKFCELFTLSMKVETSYVCWPLCQSEMRKQQIHFAKFAVLRSVK